MFHRGMESAMFNPDFLQERLGLTDDQVDRINAINDRFRKERQAVMEKIRPGERALRKILRAETPDADKAQPIVNELAGLHAQMRMIGIRHHIEIDKVLTADQRTKMRRPGARSSMPSGGAKGPIGFAPGAMGMPGDEPADDCGFEESES